MNNRITLFLSGALMLFSAECRSFAAEKDLITLLREIKGISGSLLTYRYKVVLNNLTTNEQLDAVMGRYYKREAYYLDSNGAQINVRDEDYMLRIDQRAKTIYSQNMRRMEHLTKRRLAPQAVDYLNFEELFAQHAATCKAGKDESGNTVLDVQYKDYRVGRLRAVIDREKNLVSLVLRTVINRGENVKLEQVLEMSDFSDRFDRKTVSSARFLRGKGKTIKPVSAYEKYKLIVLI
jgi:hypothetical protein